MRFVVNPSDGMPIYRQIMQQVIDAIAGGALAPGDQLPSHRELAQALVVAPLTIKKAYDELERGGYIRMQRGQGSFVAQRASMSAEEKLERITPLVRRLVHEAAVLGIDNRSLRRLLAEQTEALKRVQQKD